MIGRLARHGRRDWRGSQGHGSGSLTVTPPPSASLPPLPGSRAALRPHARLRQSLSFGDARCYRLDLPLQATDFSTETLQPDCDSAPEGNFSPTPLPPPLQTPLSFAAVQRFLVTAPQFSSQRLSRQQLQQAAAAAAAAAAAGWRVFTECAAAAHDDSFIRSSHTRLRLSLSVSLSLRLSTPVCNLPVSIVSFCPRPSTSVSVRIRLPPLVSVRLPLPLSVSGVSVPSPSVSVRLRPVSVRFSLHLLPVSERLPFVCRCRFLCSCAVLFGGLASWQDGLLRSLADSSHGFLPSSVRGWPEGYASRVSNA